MLSYEDHAKYLWGILNVFLHNDEMMKVSRGAEQMKKKGSLSCQLTPLKCIPWHMP